MTPTPTRVASPWDALLHPRPQRRQALATNSTADERPGNKTAGLLAELAECGTATTLTLAVRSDLTPRQVWGLLKSPRSMGQVRFDAGRWELVSNFAGRDVERAAALLRSRGWRVERPTT